MAAEQKRQSELFSDNTEVSTDSKNSSVINLIEDNSEDKASTDKDADDDPQFHSAEEDGNEDNENSPHDLKNITIFEKPTSHEKTEVSSTELIDEDGGGEGIAESVEIEKEFLDKELLDVSEDDDKQDHSECVVQDAPIKDEKENIEIANNNVSVAVNQSVPANIKQFVMVDISQSVPSDVSQSLPVDVSQSPSEDVSQSLPEDASQSLPEDVSQSLSEDVRQSLPEDVMQSLPEDVMQSLPEDVMQSLSEDIMQCLPEDVSQSLQEDVNQSLPEDINQSLQEDISQSPSDVSQDTKESSIECKDTNENEEDEYDDEEEDEEEGDDKKEYVEDDYEDEIVSDEEEGEGCIDGDEAPFVKGERQQGDGEECDSISANEKELDFDEDRRNPQYIPKKGIFYEHDDRIIEAPQEIEAEATRDKKKKKLWSDDGKWGHDRYKEDEQNPKSRNELVEVYGYDIRCEDGPPRARRRRRYGRGPMKYEPNWEEEKPERKERTLGMFIRRGTRGGRVRGPSRGGSFRGTGRPYHKMDDNFINNNNESIRTNDKRSFQSYPPKQPKEDFQSYPPKHSKEDFHVRENIPPKMGMNKPKNEVNVSGWEDDFPAINTVAPKKVVNIGGHELENFKITTSTNNREKIKETSENICGWESDGETKPSHTKKEDNICGWESEEETKPVKPVQHKKQDNICGWESDENTSEKPVSLIINKDFSSVAPTKEPSFQSSPTDRNSAFIRKKPAFVSKEPQDKSSVKTLTFENSLYNNNNRPFPSYEKPPRHEALRGPMRSSRRTSRGRTTRGSERYSNNNNESYIKPTVGPRLLDKQMNRMNTEFERLNLSNRHQPRDNIESLNAYEQKHNIITKGNVHRPINTVSSSKNEDSVSRSKRYSHTRQKTLPETSSYQTSTAVPSQHPPYYDPSYQQTLYASDAVTPSPQPPSSGSPPVISPPQYQPYNPSPYPESFRVPIPVTNTPRLYPQVTVPAGQPINMTPSPCITPAASLMNYPAPPTAQPAYPPQYAYQQYPQPAPPPPPPVEFQEMGLY